MSNNFLEQLKQLDAEATPGPWIADSEATYIFAPDTNPVAEMRGYGAGEPQEPNQELICLLRNNTQTIIELVQIAQQILVTDLDGYNERKLSDALSKLKGDV
jgi:hypothetical protein